MLRLLRVGLIRAEGLTTLGHVAEKQRVSVDQSAAAQSLQSVQSSVAPSIATCRHAWGGKSRTVSTYGDALKFTSTHWLAQQSSAEVAICRVLAANTITQQHLLEYAVIRRLFHAAWPDQGCVLVLLPPHAVEGVDQFNV